MYLHLTFIFKNHNVLTDLFARGPDLKEFGTPSCLLPTSCSENIVVVRLSIATTRYFGYYNRGIKVELIVYIVRTLQKRETIRNGKHNHVSQSRDLPH